MSAQPQLPPPLPNPAAPYSQEAEEAVLGAILVDSTLMNDIPFLQLDDFFMLRHQYIFDAMQRLHQEHSPIDALTLGETLTNMRVLEEVGGRVYLTRLINNTANPLYATVYAQIVHRAAIRRRMLEAADKIRALALDEEKNIDAVLGGAGEAVKAVMYARRDAQTERAVWEYASEYYDALARRVQGKEAPGLPSGFTDADAIIGGFRRGDLVIIAGRPGMGKSAILLQMALNMAKQGVRCAFFPLEMTALQLVERMLSIESGVFLSKLRSGRLSPPETARVVDALGVISELPIVLDDAGRLSPDELRHKARRIQHEHGLDAVFIDYLQLMNGGNGKFGSRELEIGHISRELKAMAKGDDLNIPIFAAAQLNREVTKRRNKRPTMEDLRESGQVEQDADIIMLLYRDEVYNEDTEFPNQADLIIGKHRSGSTGTVSLYFEKALTRFSNGSTHRIDMELL